MDGGFEAVSGRSPWLRILTVPERVSVLVSVPCSFYREREQRVGGKGKGGHADDGQLPSIYGHNRSRRARPNMQIIITLILSRVVGRVKNPVRRDICTGIIGQPAAAAV